MDITQICPEKLLTLEESAEKIKTGARVFIGTGCGEPQALIKAMVNNKSIQDVFLYQMLAYTLTEYITRKDFLSRFSLKLFLIAEHMRQFAYEGKIDYIPVYLSRIPQMFASKEIDLDVALIQVSPPDKYGYCSLGISVDITLSGMQNAQMVIAQVNPQMPRTLGESLIHIDSIDYMVVHEEPLVEALSVKREEKITQRIAHYINMLVDDGATIQIGFGHLPSAILPYLSNKKDLGLHTQLLRDEHLQLFEQKVITNRRKNYIPHRVVASLCMGTKKLYDYVDKNPMFTFRSSAFVNDPNVIGKNDHFISISSALEVDITGQACSDSKDFLFYSGVGTQVDFIRGATMSKGGFSIIVLPSTSQDGKISRIVPFLSQGAGVATTRGDVDIIVTEYGIAEMAGRSISQRVIELARIAHPKFRTWLIEEAKRCRYVFPDQMPLSTKDLIFLESYRGTLPIDNGKNIEFRPLLPCDDFESRNFYYSLQETSIYYRFFSKRKVFSREMLQQQWAYLDYQKNMTLIGLVQFGKRKRIVAIGSYAEAGKAAAEVAFLVQENLHGMGIGSFLLSSLEKIAIKNQYKKFIATVLADNQRMLKVFKKRYPHAQIVQVNKEWVEVHMEFASRES